MRSYYDHVYEACRLQSRLHEAAKRVVRDRRARDVGATAGLLARFYFASLDPRVCITFLRDAIRHGYWTTVLAGCFAAVAAMSEDTIRRNDG